MHVRDRVIYDHELESTECYDTLTQSDIVRSQYTSLPYPLVTNQQLQDEKMYYENTYKIQKIPYKINYGITLEAINHFLYKGRNSFRYALNGT